MINLYLSSRLRYAAYLGGRGIRGGWWGDRVHVRRRATGEQSSAASRWCASKLAAWTAADHQPTGAPARAGDRRWGQLGAVRRSMDLSAADADGNWGGNRCGSVLLRLVAAAALTGAASLPLSGVGVPRVGRVLPHHGWSFRLRSRDVPGVLGRGRGGAAAAHARAGGDGYSAGQSMPCRRSSRSPRCRYCPFRGQLSQHRHRLRAWAFRS